MLWHASHDGGVRIHWEPSGQVGHAGVWVLQVTQRRRTLLEAGFSSTWVLVLALYCLLNGELDPLNSVLKSRHLEMEQSWRGPG